MTVTFTSGRVENLIFPLKSMSEVITTLHKEQTIVGYEDEGIVEILKIEEYTP